MSFLDTLKKGILTATPEETEELGFKLARSVPENVAIALSGDLGSGKTTLVRGIARALAINRTVTSPTYTIYTIYEGVRQLVHVDAYRLSNAHDLDSLSIDELLSPPFLLAVEWPQHIREFLSEFPVFELKLRLMPDRRHEVKLLRA